jgi:hypothetical protein
VRKQEALEDEDYALRLTVALVKEMRALSEAQGARFLVATFPSGLGQATPPRLHRRFHEALDAEGVWLVDMGAAMRAWDEDAKEATIDRTGHLGPRGHAVAAAVLEREINARVPPPSTPPTL